jgi:predicted Zn-dependent protease
VSPPAPTDDYQRFRFAVLRHPVPNAFALPDGRIFVHEGLLALLENEAQLASVLAHESMHVEGHHSIVNARQARRKSGGLLAFRVALSAAAPELGYLATALTDQIVSMMVIQAIIGYGRELEEESDRNAVERLLAAGYDPSEMPRTFELLGEDPEGERPMPKPKWSSHPLAVQRAAYLRELLEELAPEIERAAAEHGGLRVGELDFADAVHDSALRSVQEYLDADRPRMALWLSKRNVERWADDPRFRAQLGESWRLLDARLAELPEERLTREAKKQAARERVTTTREEQLEQRLELDGARERLEHNLARAEEAYHAALELESEHPPALRGLGRLEEMRGNDLEAGRWLARYLRAAPEATDRPVVLRRLEEITERLRVAAAEAP